MKDRVRGTKKEEKTVRGTKKEKKKTARGTKKEEKNGGGKTKMEGSERQSEGQKKKKKQ